VSEFHAEAPQATASEVLAQFPYVAARAGFEPATLRAMIPTYVCCKMDQMSQMSDIARKWKNRIKVEFAHF